MGNGGKIRGRCGSHQLRLCEQHTYSRARFRRSRSARTHAIAPDMSGTSSSKGQRHGTRRSMQQRDIARLMRALDGGVASRLSELRTLAIVVLIWETGLPPSAILN